MINFGVVWKIIGIALVMLGILMLFPSFFSFVNNLDDLRGLLTASFITISFGGSLSLFHRHSSNSIGKREGYLIVSLAWITIAIFSALPYFTSGNTGSVTDAVFESISGLTTTGATIFNNIESLPKGILLWRSMTQWVGGMGIIVLTVALFPLLGIGGVELFVAESPGPTSNKIHPRITETAKRLWLIYVSLTITLIGVLKLEKMPLYDAVNHGLTTIATGGFSTKNASIAYFDSPLIQYTLILFMFIAGTNYTLIYFGLKGKLKRVWASDEFKAYIAFVVLTIALVWGTLQLVTNLPVEQSFRDAAFQVISIVTTTGYVSADYTSWHASLTILFFCLLFTGACAGSTAGGIKVIRHYVFAKNSYLEFKRLLHPNSLIRVKIDHKLVAPRVLTHVLVFLLIYLIIFSVATVLMTAILHDFQQPILTAAGAVATSLGNVGPAIGQVGPMDNFAQIPLTGKWLLAFVMLLGRLELFSILILFTPYFWRAN